MDPKILIMSTYLYDTLNINTKAKLKRVNRIINDPLLKSKNIKITGEGTSEQLKLLKAIIIKYITNMIDYK